MRPTTIFLVMILFALCGVAFVTWDLKSMILPPREVDPETAHRETKERFLAWAKSGFDRSKLNERLVHCVWNCFREGDDEEGYKEILRTATDVRKLENAKFPEGADTCYSWVFDKEEGHRVEVYVGDFYAGGGRTVRVIVYRRLVIEEWLT